MSEVAKLMEAVGCLIGGLAAIESLSPDEEARGEATRAIDSALALAPMFGEHVKRTRAAMATVKAQVDAARAKQVADQTTEAPVEPAPTTQPAATGTGTGG